MTRIKRPLNKETVRKANEALRAETGGRQLTNEPEDAALREKWRQAYLKAAGEEPEQKKSEKPVDGTTEECPNNKWIEVQLQRKRRSDAPDWWPPEGPLGYGEESFEMELTNGKQSGSLGQRGSIAFRNIPAGACTFKCLEFYEEVEDWLSDRLS